TTNSRACPTIVISLSFVKAFLCGFLLATSGNPLHVTATSHRPRSFLNKGASLSVIHCLFTGTYCELRT
ncbi:MAG: hypothetical protein OXL95_00530, partial [Nitrospira sp.]|nr:hypothetical protein [Nitrospira sp.]